MFKMIVGIIWLGILILLLGWIVSKLADCARKPKENIDKIYRNEATKRYK